MFQEIRIRGLGVIEDAVLALSPGLNVLTGETGAGKTMVVSGLGLLLGARGDSALVRAGSDGALVEGVVVLPPGHPARARAIEAGGAVDEELFLARTVTRDGRSRAHVGGRSAPVGVLAELGELLVAVHGQADQWRLRQGEQHREVLDAFGGPEVGSRLADYQRVHDELVTTTRERDRLGEAERHRARDVADLQAALEQIEQVDPRPGEDVRLREEDERLAHADGLRLAAGEAHLLLAGEDEAYAGGGPSGVLDRLAAARSALAPMTAHDPALRALDGRLAEIGYLVGDLSGDLAAYLAGVEADPARLAWVQQRRADLTALVRRYGDSADDVLAWAKDAASRLAELVGADDRVAQLEAATMRLRAELAAAALSLSAARRAAAADFARRVTEELGHLAMGRAEVTVRVTARPDADGLALVPGEAPVRFGRHGVDDVEILLAANPGSPARGVARAASGGELSRVMLALEVVSGAVGPSAVPTFVFDEVDAGIGGRTAVDVGARLAALATHAQVIVVTHLAQVAAFADRHLVVHKSDDGLVTSSSVVQVRDERRLAELSRMMGGDARSSAGLEHARELLEQAAALTRGLGAPPRRARARG